jgi:hypothetical protein
MSGYYSIAKDLLVSHPKIGCLMHYESVDLDKGPCIYESFDAFTGRQFSFRVLLFDLVLSAAE